MLYQFDTDSLSHAKAALLLYAMYRSRKPSSPLNGLETWDRFNTFARAACLKSRNTAEFVQNFCRKADIGSVKPCYLSTGEPVVLPDTGELIEAQGLHDSNKRHKLNEQMMNNKKFLNTFKKPYPKYSNTWSDTEIYMLKTWTGTDESLARALKRTKNAVRIKRCRLNRDDR